MSGLRLVTRADWEAESSGKIDTLYAPVTAVFVGFSGREECQNPDTCLEAIRRLQYMDMYTKNLPEITCNFFIGGDGQVYECRGWSLVPQLPYKYEEYVQSSILISYAGHYQFNGREPTPVMVEALEALLRYGVVNDMIHPTFLQFSL